MENSEKYIRIYDLDMLCPICGKPDWCMISKDGKKVICPRIKSNIYIEETGYLHYINGVNIMAKSIKSVKSKQTSIDWYSLNEQYQYEYDISASKNKIFNDLVKKWNVSVWSLWEMEIGYIRKQHCFTFPVYDENEKICGIQRIYPDNSKKMISGSKVGIYIPWKTDCDLPIFVTEGISDTAAIYDLGLNVIGRLSAYSGKNILKKLLTDSPRIVIIADNDKAGIDGALKLQKVLLNSIVVRPPKGKDIRECISILGKREVKKWLIQNL